MNLTKLFLFVGIGAFLFLVACQGDPVIPSFPPGTPTPPGPFCGNEELTGKNWGMHCKEYTNDPGGMDACKEGCAAWCNDAKIKCSWSDEQRDDCATACRSGVIHNMFGIPGPDPNEYEVCQAWSEYQNAECNGDDLTTCPEYIEWMELVELYDIYDSIPPTEFCEDRDPRLNSDDN